MTNNQDIFNFDQLRANLVQKKNTLQPLCIINVINIHQDGNMDISLIPYKKNGNVGAKMLIILVARISSEQIKKMVHDKLFIAKQTIVQLVDYTVDDKRDTDTSSDITTHTFYLIVKNMIIVETFSKPIILPDLSATTEAVDDYMNVDNLTDIVSENKNNKRKATDDEEKKLAIVDEKKNEAEDESSGSNNNKKMKIEYKFCYFADLNIDSSRFKILARLLFQEKSFFDNDNKPKLTMLFIDKNERTFSALIFNSEAIKYYEAGFSAGQLLLLKDFKVSNVNHKYANTATGKVQLNLKENSDFKNCITKYEETGPFDEEEKQSYVPFPKIDNLISIGTLPLLERQNWKTKQPENFMLGNFMVVIVEMSDVQETISSGGTPWHCSTMTVMDISSIQNGQSFTIKLMFQTATLLTKERVNYISPAKKADGTYDFTDSPFLYLQGVEITKFNDRSPYQLTFKVEKFSILSKVNIYYPYKYPAYYLSPDIATPDLEPVRLLRQELDNFKNKNLLVYNDSDKMKPKDPYSVQRKRLSEMSELNPENKLWVTVKGTCDTVCYNDSIDSIYTFRCQYQTGSDAFSICRKPINKEGRCDKHGSQEGKPSYRFGVILDDGNSQFRFEIPDHLGHHFLEIEADKLHNRLNDSQNRIELHEVLKTPINKTFILLCSVELSNFNDKLEKSIRVMGIVPMDLEKEHKLLNANISSLLANVNNNSNRDE
jgi:hypothetical protein